MDLAAILRLIGLVALAPIAVMPLVWPVFAGSLVTSTVMLVVMTPVRKRAERQGRGATLPLRGSRLRLAAIVFLGPLGLWYAFIALAYLTLIVLSGAIAGVL